MASKKTVSPGGDAAAATPTSTIRFVKATKTMWVYSFLFNDKLPMGTIYLPMVLYPDKPADGQLLSLKVLP